VITLSDEQAKQTEILEKILEELKTIKAEVATTKSYVFNMLDPEAKRKVRIEELAKENEQVRQDVAKEIENAKKKQK
jgi:septal ring factor EnvC (AmiA/AmiB activator)